MKPEMHTTAASAVDEELATNLIHVLEHGKGTLDVVREVAHNGVQEDAFYVLDIGDVVRKHKEWKLKLPRVAPFYGK